MRQVGIPSYYRSQSKRYSYSQAVRGRLGGRGQKESCNQAVSDAWVARGPERLGDGNILLQGCGGHEQAVPVIPQGNSWPVVVLLHPESGPEVCMFPWGREHSTVQAQGVSLHMPSQTLSRVPSLCAAGIPESTLRMEGRETFRWTEPD